MPDSKAVILVVDDTPDNIVLLSGLLKERYKVKVATNGEKALAIAKAAPPDLILLDIMMPVMDGYETCRRLKEDPELEDIPVIFLTAKEQAEEENMGFELGAVDYITKPISAPVLLSRVKTHVTLKQSRDFLKDKNHFLEAEISRRTKEVSLIQDVSIMSMAALAEIRDNDTGNHIKRTKLYIEVLATHLSSLPGYKGALNRETIDLITTSAPLHDIGKVGIPDHILLKPGPLTREEFEIMKTHTILGRDAILRAEELMGQKETFFRYAKEIVLSHHEKWDGSGYPEGLAGEDIPLSARLMAIADVYDALTSKRVYKDAMPHERAVDIITGDSGKHFDPDIVEVFLRCRAKFREISRRYKEEEMSETGPVSAP
ncbi:two-component system response regulator [Paenibacillus sp. HN-1]|uniref:response regulator n=1 Tax=Paenibacillus TaxID=44249 RepID=UPI001CAA0A98|nr:MULTISPECIES: two-component system response regulator [Paenibacillus]MBY9080245.1 two-component system response regulator [Paenibacillus sp. CGMCC 1.18879]MBY9083096.1 two-component system response regulator [Paenibacillus sinensis]